MRVGEVGIISQQNCAREAFSVAAFGGCWLENQILYNQQNFTLCILEVKNLSSEILNDLLPWTKAVAQSLSFMAQILWSHQNKCYQNTPFKSFFFFLGCDNLWLQDLTFTLSAECHMVSSSLLPCFISSFGVLFTRRILVVILAILRVKRDTAITMC